MPTTRAQALSKPKPKACPQPLSKILCNLWWVSLLVGLLVGRIWAHVTLLRTDSYTTLISYSRSPLIVLWLTSLIPVVLTHPLPVPARTFCAIQSHFQLGCKSWTQNYCLLHANGNTNSILKGQLLQEEKSFSGFDSHGRSAFDSFVLQDFVRPFGYSEELVLLVKLILIDFTDRSEFLLERADQESSCCTWEKIDLVVMPHFWESVFQALEQAAQGSGGVTIFGGI